MHNSQLFSTFSTPEDAFSESRSLSAADIFLSITSVAKLLVTSSGGRALLEDRNLLWIYLTFCTITVTLPFLQSSKRRCKQEVCSLAFNFAEGFCSSSVGKIIYTFIRIELRRVELFQPEYQFFYKHFTRLSRWYLEQFFSHCHYKVLCCIDQWTQFTVFANGLIIVTLKNAFSHPCQKPLLW